MHNHSLELAGCVFLLGSLLPGTAAALELDDLLDPKAEVALLASGYRFTEGPAYSPSGFLLFSDIPNSRIVKRLSDGTTTDYVRPSGAANGLVFDARGHLYACQGGARRVVRFAPEHNDNPTVLVEKFDGKKLNSPNDISLDDHGGFYFTDPRYGSADDLEQPTMGVYYVDAAGTVSRVIEDLGKPNGILVSPKGDYLYVAETNDRQLHRFPIVAAGKLGADKITYTADPELDRGGPDGLALDIHGNVYATFRNITVLSPKLAVIGRIEVPKGPANCTFGDADRQTLYITAKDSLYSIRLKVAGFPLRARSADGPTREVTFGSLELRVPAAWKQVEPESRMRLGQFEIPAAGGESAPASLVVFHFGAAGAGSAEDNAQRWIGQFAPEGREVSIEEGKAGGKAYTLVDLSGTYNQPVGPPVLGRSKPVANSRVINVMLDADDGAYFLKLAGGKTTVGAAAPALRQAIGAQPGAAAARGAQ